MRRQCLTLAFIAAVFVAVPHAGGAEQWPFKRGAKDQQYKPFQPPSQRYTVEYPVDWQPQPGGMGSVVFTQKKAEATISIEYATLAVALDPGDITDTTAGYEIDHIKSQLPKADAFKREIRTENNRRLIVIDYTRPSISGGLERVRQYSLILGKDVYRISCSAAPALFDKYDPIFSHVVATFQPSASAP